MLQDYAPILVLFALVIGFAVANLLISDLLGAKRTGIDKGTAYESGLGSIERGARIRVSIHFYLVAVLFILFDVESLLLLPWAVAARDMAEAGVGPIVFWEILGFVGVLALGLAYVWRKGGLSWDR